MKVRWGIIGCGNVTEVKSGPGLQKAEGSELVAVMRRTPHLAEDYAHRHKVSHWTTDASKLIHHPEVDAVYIATAPDSHLDYALQVCAAGKPAYVEKPMARNATEAQAMVEAFHRAGLKLFVAHYRRALPRFLKAKELLDNGAIGQLTSITYRFASPQHRAIDPQQLPWRLQAAHSGGGLFLDLAPHTLDVLDFLVGPLIQVSGRASNVVSAYAVEDVVAMSYTTQAGVPGVALWNFASDMRLDEFEFMGSAGCLRLSTFGETPLRLSTQGNEQIIAVANPVHIQQPLIQTIVDELLGKGHCPSPGIDALRTSWVMDAALEGYYGGRADTFWERTQTWPGKRHRLT